MNDRTEKKPSAVDDERSIDNTPMVKTVSFSDFAGSDACRKCHAGIYKIHSGTSHFSTSAQASEKTIKGSFKKGKNRFDYNDDLYVEMEKRDSGLCQVVYFHGEEKIALKFGMVIGSGTKGQSFARWQGNELFQLPLTYYTVAGRWANSPGFPNKVQFERPITGRCMECHATFAEVSPPSETGIEKFNRENIILGIACEKCHGPGADHAKFYTENPNAKGVKNIINPAKLDRTQKLELCALCHGGRLQSKKPPFSYVAGDSLGDYYNTAQLHKTGRNYMSVDVHGNQFGLLSASKCFLKSNMTCNTCHDAHANERGKTELFSSRCQSCHQGGHNTSPALANVSRTVIKSNCIDCHMAVEPSHVIVFTSGMEAPKAASFRSHFISVYPKETAKFIASLRNKQ